jgi:hypothetical protein
LRELLRWRAFCARLRWLGLQDRRSFAVARLVIGVRRDDRLVAVGVAADSARRRRRGG